MCWTSSGSNKLASEGKVAAKTIASFVQVLLAPDAPCCVVAMHHGQAYTVPAQAFSSGLCRQIVAQMGS